MAYFTYEGKQYEYDVSLSRGKKIRLSVDERGVITLHRPRYVSVKEAEAFLFSQRAWLAEKQRKMQKSCAGFIHTFAPGDQFYYLGQPYALQLKEETSKKHVYVERLPDSFLIKGQGLTPEKVKLAMETWYKKNARIKYENRCAYYAPLLGVSYQSIRIKNQKGCWGSCSAKNNLNFNWRLIMGIPEALDYVVVHELCHLRELNHSIRFWKLVASLLPDYKQREAWILEQQNKILLW